MVAENVGPGIRDAVLEALERTQDGWDTPHQRLSATGACLRQQYYKISGVPGTRYRAGALWEMGDGDIHEADIKARLRTAGYTVTRDTTDGERLVAVALPDGTRVPGHIDGVVEGPGLGMPHLLEIKSMSWMRFGSVVMDGLAASHDDYLLQINAYLLGARQAGELWGDACLFIAKAKDSSAAGMKLRNQPDLAKKLYIERIPFDPEVAERAVYRQTQLREALQESRLPLREYARSDWRCQPRWCNWAERCNHDGA